MRTDKQEAFIEAYCLTGNASKAVQMAGYAEKAAKQMGHKLKNQFEFEIQEKTNQMKAMAAELNMYQAQVNEYKYEIERLTRELQDMKRKYYEQKRRE